ncbi:MAG: AMP-binding protein [Methylococcaceae bacterium]|nr:AMP-binding protein [Methylococcaceae bacterium]MDZ4156781.1 AMP-binding protein [Methylococcales bacterium]MDP2393315.1 AMP-binding protein [Methylococcaceae bacterium]MDP3018364.1 AMP-binding protein [Methylococcaceae bacterium]MDP3389325.1 AMP-binding protein [Methylococcaceae bacterium]
MFNKLVPLSHYLVTPKAANDVIATHAGQTYSAKQFADAVKFWVNKLQAQPVQRYALYTEDTYPFAVMLFALLHAGKEIWIPGNNRPGTAQQLPQDCQLLGDWDAGKPIDYYLQTTEYSSLSLAPLNAFEPQLVIFTSGSTGQPEPIAKCLNQFQLEIDALEQLWGAQLGNAQALATVSHQHIYGLLFRVLWPLSAGRCFHSQTAINPEILIKSAGSIPAYWIASPAHLKRLDQHSPWSGIADLKAIFSSGGALPENAAQQIMTFSGQTVLEIYGSSETGGIAWRTQEKTWTLFSGMHLTFKNDSWHLHSPYLVIPENCQLNDQLTVLDDGRFLLHGRSDRIVKIEEKRLSLTELEQRLLTLPWIDEAHALVIAKSRDLVAVTVVLSQSGAEQLATQGRNPLIKQLRKALEPWFEAVVLPRKWLFVNTMPLTPQGKIDQHLLTSLLDVDNRKLPQALNLVITADDIKLGLKVPEDLVYFPDHFASYPLLPGVVQLAWAEHFGKLFFVINKPFRHMEVIKFIKIIQPGDELTLTLNWKANTGKLYFNFSSAQGPHSSGRMVYEGNK